MKAKNKTVCDLLDYYKEIALIGSIESVLGWDLSVNLPPKASEERAEQAAYLTKLASDKWLNEGFRKLLEDATKEIERLGNEEAAIVRNLNHSAKFYHKVPQDIIIEFSKTSSMAFMAWQKAKEQDNFKEFEPHLTKMVSLNQIVAKHIGYKSNPYDALLDLYEPGLTAANGRRIFGKLQPELTSILKKILKSKTYKDKSLDNLTVDKNYPVELQKQISLFVLRKTGYDLEAGRMDISSHPFTSSLGRHDVRITNRYKANDFRESIMIALHEGGHALYDQGVNEKYEYTPLDGGVSLGIHESQSRFWENQMGRSLEFMQYLSPVLHAFFPEQLKDTGDEKLFRFFNRVTPSLIRTEADEVTYNLHIALRFELEEALVNDKVKVKDLPGIWREKMKKYLGVVPAADREGVLQDVHWSHGPMGYFPTYTLGNFICGAVYQYA